MKPRVTPAPERSRLFSRGPSYTPALMVLLVGMAFTLVVMLLVLEKAQEERRARFLRDASLYLTTIQRSIDRTIEVLESINGLFAASERVERSEFHAFAQRAMHKHEEIQALEFVPIVNDSQRPVFEERARREGHPDFTFREISWDGTLQKASRRPVYFPVYYLYPLKGNEAALGFDLASEPTRRSVLSRSRMSGLMTATPPVTLVQETGNQYGFLLFNPIFRDEVPVLFEPGFVGFSLGVFRINDLLEKSLEGISMPGLHLLLLDTTSPGAESVLAHFIAGPGAASPSRELPAGVAEDAMTWRGGLYIPGRSWYVDFYADTAYSADGNPLWTAALTLVIGFSLTFMGAFYLYGAARYIERAMGLVLELEQAKEELESRNRDLEDFAYMVAHDLRTPLVSIHGFLELLARSLNKVLDDQQKWIVDRISANLTHFDDLLGDLLQYSRIGEGALERDRLSIKALVDQIAVELRDEIQKHGATVVVQEGLPDIYLNGTRCYQLLSNLIANGIRFHTVGAAPVVEVGMVSDPPTDLPRGHGLFFVRDNGIGIARADQEKVFRLFYQADKEKYGGSGAGLAIVKRIIEQENGRIWIESSPGQGATFFFTLPV